MKSIVLIHSVSSLALSFKKELTQYLLEEVKIYNIWDDFLAINPNEVGEFTIANRNRLLYDIRSAELTGADLIVVTCSTLTSAVEQIRPFISVPIIAIDDALGRLAVRQGQKILVLATADSAAKATVRKLTAEALAIQKKVQLKAVVIAEAFTALKQLEIDRHNEIILSGLKGLSGYDCIVLAQASMAHLAAEISQQCNTTVLASPSLCMEEVQQELSKIR